MISSPKVPFMQLPTIAFLLAIASGMLDGYAFFTTKSFATFQSGNIIMLGYEFAKHGLTAVMPYIVSIISFGAGAMLLAWIRYRYNTDEKTWTFTLLSLEIVLLLLLIVYIFFFNVHSNGFHAVWALSFIAGMQGNAFHKINGMLYGNIAVTLNVQLGFSSLAESIAFKGQERKSALYKSYCYFLTLLGFAGGAFMMVLLADFTKEYALFATLIPLCLIFFFGHQFSKENKGVPIDSN
ncbi:Predicted membrane protein [Providencia rettgeri]|uniref:YoaK family protein n=1 Tax=Providencia TaxID=586 RepID=UPI001EF56335|nr:MULTISPECIES: YoaK family protein [Providencia]WIE08248.1 YoaK family protein [Providencia rettgeri]WOB90994.1 YoaK family protein [Providencia sp. PROV175]CAB5591391.1 Predicted membrane protein [Providencia rettgeri]CAC9170696.1 Predicted membrane protein [Providencia rettgeri]